MCYSWKCREIIGVGIKTDEHHGCYKKQHDTTYHGHESGSLFSHHNSIPSKILSHLSPFAASRWEFSQWAAPTLRSSHCRAFRAPIARSQTTVCCHARPQALEQGFTRS